MSWGLGPASQSPLFLIRKSLAHGVGERIRGNVWSCDAILSTFWVLSFHRYHRPHCHRGIGINNLIFWYVSLVASLGLPLFVFIQKEWKLEQAGWMPAVAMPCYCQMVVLISALAMRKVEPKLV